jgi:hypothetical protein
MFARTLLCFRSTSAQQQALLSVASPANSQRGLSAVTADAVAKPKETIQ